VKKYLAQWLLLAALLISDGDSVLAQKNTIPLVGKWRFRLGAGDVGVEQKLSVANRQEFDRDTVRLDIPISFAA